MTHQVTIYSSPNPLGHIVRSGTGTYQQRAAMWNTVTNLLRIVKIILQCYYCKDQQYYITSDGHYYIIKRK